MKKEIMLIQCLLKQEPLTAKTLAKKINVSTRSINNYIARINNTNEGMISSSHDGYRINERKAYEMINSLSEGKRIPQSSNERVIYIINELIKGNNNQELNIYDISEDIFVSTSTIKNDLKKVKKELRKNDLDLYIKGDFIKVIGTEKNKRKMLSSILYEENHMNLINLETIQQSFQDINIYVIKNIISSLFEKYHFFINDYSLSNLVLHIALSIERIQENIYDDQQSPIQNTSREYQLAKDLAHSLELYFHIKFNTTEIYEMMLLIKSRATDINYQTINIESIKEYVGDDCFTLVQNIIKHVYSLYSINLNRDDFLIRFTLHIHNLLIRSQSGYLSRNPLKKEIKDSYPLIYDMAVSVTKYIIDETHIAMNDDEIAYIAFHFGNLLETQKVMNSKISVIIFCPTYYDMGLKLANSYKHHFSQEILITDLLTKEEDLAHIHNTDLIISTVPIDHTKSEIPVLQTDLFFNQNSQNKLENKIKEIHKLHSQNEFRHYLNNLIIPEFFEINNHISNETECIDYLVKKMAKHDYVIPSFRENVLKRERLSSTAFGDFAIPHSMKMDAIKTGINVIISKKPINWNGQPVHLVMLMSFNKNERYIFNKIYEIITMILSENDNVKKIISSNSYNEFIENFVNLIH